MNIIIFIHGLGGKPFRTWGEFNKIIKSDEKLSQYKIEFYPYPTSLLKFFPWSIFPKIQDLADGFRTFINNRTTSDDKVTVVTHSMGGLIARKYFVEEIKNKRKLRAKKLLLFACPNKGAQLAKLSWISRITQVGQMKKSSEFITELHNDWKALNVEKYIQVKYVIGGKDQVVDEDSAKYFGNSGDIENLISKNHINIVKPKNADDNTFKIFKNFVFQRLKFLIEDYDKPHIYITRKVIRVNDYDDSYFFYIRDKFQVTLFEALLKYNKVVLIAGAGEGKTREIEFLAWYSSTNNDYEIYPIKVNLKNYVGGNITSIFPENWELVPDDQSLLILDGLDEVESPFFKSVIKSIQHFSESNPKVKILITCRTNFYVLPKENYSGLIEGFEPFWLLSLEHEDIHSFASSSLKNKSEEFLKQVYENRLGEIIKIPFYLINLVEYYRSNLTLPRDIITLLNWLIESRINADIEHFKTTYDLNKKVKNVFTVLEKVALAMESLGRNYAHEVEIDKVLSIVEEKELLNYVGIISCRRSKCEFEHNIFQEFLAAKILSSQNLNVIKTFISFYPDYIKIIPSWRNTLSFIVTMYINKDLLEWLLEAQPEILIKFEVERIPSVLRIRLFKEIFNSYKKKCIWINREIFDLKELGKFASDDESLDFLIGEVSIDQHYTIVGNALELLGYVNINFVNKERIFKVLLDIITKSKIEVIITRSLYALTHQNFNDETELEKILENTDYSHSDHIRASLYHLIGSAGYTNHFIDFFLNGIKYLRQGHGTGKTTLIDEGFYLASGIEEVTSEESIEKLLEYFIQNPRDLSDVSLRDKTTKKIAKNIAKLITTTDSNIFKLSFKLLITLGDEYLFNESKGFINCFIESNTNMEVFKMILHGKFESGLRYRLLEVIANKESLDYLIEQYNSKKINDDDIYSFKNFLIIKNNTLLKEFDINLKNKTDYKEPSPKRNFEEERSVQKNREIEMFYNKELFKKEISLVFEKEKKEEFTNKDIREIERKNWESQIYATKALHIIKDFSKENPITLTVILEYYKKADFDFMFVGEIYSMLTQNENSNLLEKKDTEDELDEKYIERVKKWCYEHIEDIDFKTALELEPNKQKTTSYKAIYLQYFLKKFNLIYLEKILLDLLSFDFYGGGIDYLEEKISFQKIKERILENLKSGKENEEAINNYYKFGLKHKISDLIPFALDSIKNLQYDITTKKSALELLNLFDNTSDDLYQLLFDTKDEVKWEIVKALFDKKYENLEDFLLTELKSDEENNRNRASTYLIELQNIEGLEYFTERITTEMRYGEKFYERNSLKTLIIKEAIPYLLNLLELTYQKEFKHYKYERLDSEVYEALTSIALQSAENFMYVKEETEKFINAHILEYKDVNFVYAFLERLEQKYYINKSQNITIDDVLEKLKLIYS